MGGPPLLLLLPSKHEARVSLLHPTALVIPTFAGMKAVLRHSVTVSPTLT